MRIQSSFFFSSWLHFFFPSDRSPWDSSLLEKWRNVISVSSVRSPSFLLILHFSRTGIRNTGSRIILADVHMIVMLSRPLISRWIISIKALLFEIPVYFLRSNFLPTFFFFLLVFSSFHTWRIKNAVILFYHVNDRRKYRVLRNTRQVSEY